jgi:hypothetical protein
MDMLRAVVATLVLTALVGTPALAQEEPVEAAERTLTEIVLKVEGFHCDMCAKKLKEKLEKIEACGAALA